MGSILPIEDRLPINALQDLRLHLKESLQLLKSETVSAQLTEMLHNDKSLPDQDLASLAAGTIDLLSEIQTLLQPASLILADHFFGYTDTKCMVTVVELGIPDVLSRGPMTIEELAPEVGAKPLRLKQVMAPLRNNGVFAYDEISLKYSNNHVSTLLKTDHWTQWRNWVDLYGNEFYDIARGIPRAVRAEAIRSAAQINFDTDQGMFDFFNSQGWMPRLHRTLGGGATAMAPGIVHDYPWEELADETVLDIGGGGGGFISTLLRAFPTMRGSIYDLPHVIAHVSDLFSVGGMYEDLKARVPQANLISGNFLKWVPPSKVYVMKWCLHDWDDEQSVQILRHIRDAVIKSDKSRLVVFEAVLTDGNMGRLSRYGDINMMMTTNGQERSEKQWRSLAVEAGWKVDKIRSLRNAWVQAIDLRPA